MSWPTPGEKREEREGEKIEYKLLLSQIEPNTWCLDSINVLYERDSSSARILTNYKHCSNSIHLFVKIFEFNLEFDFENDLIIF